jgi:hypothetical protein
MSLWVSSWNMLKSWSSSTGSGRAAARLSDPPSGMPRSERPGVISRNFRPRADRDLITSDESSGSGSTVLSSFRSSFAV